MTGYVVIQERGEKTTEIRLESVTPLEPALLEPAAQGAAGTVTITIWKATESQLHHLKRVLDEHPGDYECVIQVIKESNCIPIYLAQHVNPTEVFKKAIAEGLVRAQVEIAHVDDDRPPSIRLSA
jgi:hypothetical protein